MFNKLLATLLLGVSTVSVAVAETARGDPAKGQALAAVCGACHGMDGNSAIPVNPSIAQQHADYIAKQLENFKSGARANAIMAPMATNLSSEDMKHLGAYFAKQKLKPVTGRNRALVDAGRKLYRAGDASRGIPSCSACHSPNGAGIPAQYPRLSGQHAEYTAGQLKAFRAGERANDANNMMRSIAAKLTDQEIAALSEYVAAVR